MSVAWLTAGAAIIAAVAAWTACETHTTHMLDLGKKCRNENANHTKGILTARYALDAQPSLKR